MTRVEEVAVESKYGRLFTESDVERIMTAGVGLMGHPLIHGFREAIDKAKAESTFPPDEPLFLLRGQDAAAPGAIAGGRNHDYAQECLNAGASRAHMQAVWKAASAMRDWQAEHPDRVKVPD